MRRRRSSRVGPTVILEHRHQRLSIYIVLVQLYRRYCTHWRITNKLGICTVSYLRWLRSGLRETPPEHRDVTSGIYVVR